MKICISHYTACNNQRLETRHSAREAAEKLLWGSTGGTVLCSRLLCFEKIFSSLGFDYRPLFLCRFVEQSNFVLHFLNVLALLFLQTFLLKVLFNQLAVVKIISLPNYKSTQPCLSIL